MKKFKFTLQSLLGVKNTMEKQQKAQMAEVQARIRAFREELKNINTRYELTRARFLEHTRKGINATELTTYNIGFSALRDKEEAQNKKIEAAEGELQRIQRALIETMKERKMLEKLREKQLAEYREEELRENEKVIGDFLANKVAAAMSREEPVSRDPAASE